MTEAQAIEAICAAFVAAWPAASGNVPLVLDNEPHPAADTFALLSIQQTGAMQRTTGGVGIRRVERSGWIVVKLWAPAGAGIADAQSTWPLSQSSNS